MPSIQAKVVGDFCNLRCTYCRDRDYEQGEKRVMSSQILEVLIKSLAQMSQKSQRIHWLGGEPTLAGLDFFKEVVVFQQKQPSKRWVNTIQTNATLINQKWAEFFKTHDFRVGVSVDGTPQTHNADRINLAGQGSYSKVMDGVYTLRGFGIYPSVICVITKKNVSLGVKILQSLVESGFTDIAFNAFYNTATDLYSDPFAVSDKEWTQFLQDIFEEWISMNRPDVKIRELDNMIAWTRGHVARSCTFRGSCSNWILVDYDGKIYPCERLGRTTYFGNIVSVDSFTEILKTDTYKKFVSQTSFIPKICEVCSMKDFCHNGCVAHRIDDNNTLPHYTYCNSRLNFYKYLVERIGTTNNLVSDDTNGPSILGN